MIAARSDGVMRKRLLRVRLLGAPRSLAGVSPTLARRRVAISRMLPNIRVTLPRLASRLNRRWWCTRHYAVRMKLFLQDVAAAAQTGGSK